MIKATKKDVVWNYVGTVVSMTSGFVLLPLLMHFLNDDELGLWYVYVAVANLAMLFEFGFNPTFARNIVFVVSGTRKLMAEGHGGPSDEEGIDWHLLNVVVRTCKLVYAALACAVLLVLMVGGSAYVGYITPDLNACTVWAAWAIFCLAIFLNLCFLHSLTILRGYGDIAGENKAKTFAKLGQLLASGILLLCGTGLIGAAIGFLINSLLLRIIAISLMRKHKSIESGRKSDAVPVSASEVKRTISVIGHLAWRDGVVSLATYASTQGMSIMSSLYLGLAGTGTYSILLQLANAVYNFACAYPRSFFPSMQAAFAEGDTKRQNKIISSSIVAYWVFILIGTIGVYVVILPVLPLFKQDIHIDCLLFLGLTVYLALLQQHSIFCNYIISMNELPYMTGFLVAAVLGLFFVSFLCGILGWGAWGIVAGQAMSQLLYNNWKWPMYLCRKIDISYLALIMDGIRYWHERLVGIGKAS